jgi:hypothetical protein
MGNTCALGELDLHALPITQKDVIRTQTETKSPTNALTDNTNIFDFVFKSNVLYTDLSEAELYLEYTIEDDNGVKLQIADDAAPVNNIAHAMFESVQLLINGEKVNGNSEEYGYKAFILDLLASEPNDKETRLKGTAKWFKDTAGAMDLRTKAIGGWRARRVDATAKETLAVVMLRHLDLLKQC